MLDGIELRASEFQAAAATLLQVQQSLRQTIGENAHALASIADASRQVQAYSTSLAGQAGTLEKLNLNQGQIVAQLTQITGSVATAMERHEACLTEYRQLFEQCEGVFNGLDGTLGSVLSTIQQGMQQYAQSVEQNLREIVKAASQLLPDIFRKFDSQTGEISEQLEELSDDLGKSLERLHGRAR